MKNIRNNWLTERLGELEFTVDGIIRTAKWGHLTKLYQLESGSLLKMSKLSEVAVAPKPIERQKVVSCLKVFCEETYHQLNTSIKDGGIRRGHGQIAPEIL